MSMKAWSHKCKVYHVTRQKFGLVYLGWPCLVLPISKGHLKSNYMQYLFHAAR